MIDPFGLDDIDQDPNGEDARPIRDPETPIVRDYDGDNVDDRWNVVPKPPFFTLDRHTPGILYNASSKTIWWKSNEGGWRPLPPGCITPYGVDADAWAKSDWNPGDGTNKIGPHPGQVWEDSNGNLVDQIKDPQPDRKFGDEPPQGDPNNWTPYFPRPEPGDEPERIPDDSGTDDSDCP
jgi:hypothetical protein